MNDKELIGKVHSAVYHQCKNRGFAAPVDVLMDVGYLSKQDYENWRYGRVDYLERVCKVNLSKLSLIMREIRPYATKTLLLLLQALGDQKWTGPQAGDPLAVQQKR